MRKKVNLRFLAGVTAMLALAAIFVAVAGAFDSGGTPAGTGPGTITWTGQGASGGKLDTTQCDANNTPYLLWILTTDGGNIQSDNTTPTLYVNGVPYQTDNPSDNSESHFVTPYFTPDPSTLTAYAQMIVTAPGNGAWNLVISHGCPGGKFDSDLTISKTANASFTRTHSWTIDKSADTDTVYSAGGGTSGAVNYTVAVTKTTVDSDWTVSGTITINNPNTAPANVTGVTDSLTGATVDCGVTFPYNLAPKGELDCTYSASVPDATNGTNTATVTWDTVGAPDTSASASADYTFGAPTVVGPDEIDVTDTNGQSWHFTDSGSESYSKTFTDPAGTCTDHTNTATIDQTGQSDSVTVADCQGADLTVSKTAAPSFDRKYKWNITKAVDKTKVNITSGTATFNYTVSVSHDSGTDSGWTVAGTITVTNPNDWEDITANVTDALPGGNCSVTGGAGAVIPKSDSKTFDYSCTFTSNPGTGTNTGTATWDATTAHTPDATASGSADFAFGAPTNVIDECVSVSDPIDPNSPHSYCVGDPGDPTFSFTYSRTVDAPPLATCQSYDNTATFTTNDTGTTGSASKTVTVCANYNALTPGYWKTHLNSGSPNTKHYLPKSLGNFPVSSTSIASAVFNAMNCSSSSSQDAIGCLAGHLLAAELNIANGSPAVSCITTCIANANAFLSGQTVNGVPGITYTGPGGTYNLTPAQRSLAISLKNTLDSYNNGKGC